MEVGHEIYKQAAIEALYQVGDSFGDTVQSCEIRFDCLFLFRSNRQVAQKFQHIRWGAQQINDSLPTIDLTPCL